MVDRRLYQRDERDFLGIADKVDQADGGGDNVWSERVSIWQRSGQTIAVVGDVNATIVSQPIRTTRDDWPATVMLPSAVRNTSTLTAIDLGGAGPCVMLVLRVTAAAGGGQVLAPYLADPSNVVALWVATANITVPGNYVYMFGPGISGGALAGVTERVNMMTADGSIFVITHSGAGNWTYSLTLYRAW